MATSRDSVAIKTNDMCTVFLTVQPESTWVSLGTQVHIQSSGRQDRSREMELIGLGSNADSAHFIAIGLCGLGQAA